MARVLIVILISFLTSCSTPPQKQTSIAKKGVNALAISDDNKFAIVASTNHEVGVWDINKNKLLYTWKHGKNKSPNILAISISHNNLFAVTAEKNNLVWWNLRNGKPLRFLANKVDIQAIALSADGQRLLIGQNDAKAIYIDLSSGQKLKEFSQYETINTVALSNDGNYAITGGDDKLAILWDLNTNKPLYQWQHKKRVRFSTFSKDSHYALTSAPQSEVNIWKIDSGMRLSQIAHKRISITGATFSKDSRFYAIGTLPNQIQLRQTNSSKKIQSWTIAKKKKWKPTSTFIYAISFINENTLLTGDSQGDLSWWQKTK
jgi:WD40 repeat protein